jgi:uncharacterized membrane protein
LSLTVDSFSLAMNRVSRFLTLSFASFCLVNSLSLPTVLKEQSWQWDQAAYAKRSGGRSRGGSFNRPSNSNGGNGGSGGNSREFNGGGSSGGAYPVPVGGYGYGGYGYGSGGIGFGGLMLVGLILVGGVGLAVWYLMWANKGRSSLGNRELDNDIVTVTKVQVALLAEGKAIQTQLAEVVANADLSTQDGMLQHVQEAVLALLRMPENWSHVRTSSTTYKTREQAKTEFEKLSVTERTKYTEETLSNVAGQIKQKEYTLDPEKDPASYIIVTLLLGTADDKPLFDEVRSTEALEAALKRISSLSPEYLLIFELIWTPEAEGDSMTYDEMLMEYSDMLQI